jgi:adenine phosphoribosyltransferase
MLTLQKIQSLIKDYPDFPKPGVIFKDIMPVLSHPEGLSSFNKHFQNQLDKLNDKPDAIIGIDARGFILGAALASELNLPFVPVRKKGKLPGEVISYEYELEYGSDYLEIQKSIVRNYRNVVLVDDLLATGGTISATEKLCSHLGLNILCSLFVIELVDLCGRKKLNRPIYTMFSY